METVDNTSKKVVKYSCDITEYFFQVQSILLLVEVYPFRVIKIFARKSSFYVVSQQSEKNIFTGVVSFCGATLFILQFFRRSFYEKEMVGLFT